ncbi:uncharacterized protein DEA37_0000812, partial [Paragonimus westermani]
MYTLIVAPSVSDETPLVFSPPDGLLRVGSSQHIYCLPQGAASSDREEVERICRARRIPCNSIRLIDVGGHTDLLSTDHSSVPVRIRPPSGKSSYTRYGSTMVSCSYVVKSGGKVERNLTVRILPEHPNGTLNGNDTGHQTVLVGQDRPFMCDLVPLDAADRLDGKWTANVYGPVADLVVVDVSNGRARVMPRDPPGFYQSVGQLQVHCVFTTPNGTILYDFNRTVTIRDETPLVFSPPDGLLRVGSSQHIYCLPQGAASSDREEVERICRARRIPCNSIRLIDVGGHTDLLSTDHSSVPVRIRPPSGKSSYTRYGSTMVSCSYVVKSGGKVERNLTVRIL